MAIITGTLLALKGAGALMAKKTAAVAAKGAAKGAMKAKAKDFVKGKVKGKLKSIAKDKLLGGGGGSGGGGGLVKRGSIGSALVKTETTNTVKQEANIAAAGRSGGSPLLNEVIEIKITTIQIKDLLASNLAQQKAADAAARKQAEKDRKAEKEAQLESGAGGGGGGMKMPKGPKVGPFEAIKRFLLMTFLGALLAFLLKHHKKVLAVFNFLTKNITATIKIFLALRKLFRMAVAKLLKGTLGLAKKLGAGTFNLIKKAIKSTGTIIFDALKTAGNALFNFLKATIEAALKFADDVAKAVTQLGKQLVQRANQISQFVQRASKAAYDAVRSGKGFTGAVDAVKKTSQEMAEEAAEKAVQEAAEKTAQEGIEKVTQEGIEKVAQEGAEKVAQEAAEKVAQEAAEKVAQETAEKVAQEAAEKVGQEVAEKVVQEGVEQVATKAGQSFLSRIPFLGGLITAIISLASGEPVTQAIFKASGAVLGGFLGSFIPIPVIGTLIGELLGEYVGDLFYTGLMGGGMDAVGKKLQEDIKGLLSAGKFVADWIGDGFSRLNEGIPSFMGVKNYLVILNPVESVPLFYKAFFTRDSMTEKKEKEPEVEQKFLGGVVNAAKDFLGMSSTEGGEAGSISTSGLVKEPKKLPGISLTKIPLKGDETYIGVRFKNNALSKGLGSIFGGNTGLGSIFGGNTGNNGGGIIRSDGPPSLGSTDVQANIQAILKAAKDMNYTGDILALLAIAKGESGIKGIPEQPITDAGRASQIWSISRAEAQQLLDSGGWRALYNEVYGWSGNSLGNRPGTNDGSDFIGRGFIQITGRHNYKDIGNRIGVDFMSNPELLLDKDIAAKATIAFMQRGGSPRDMESALRAVGGIKEGWPKKRGFYEDFKQLASEGKLKINSAQIASKDSSGADIQPVTPTPRKPTPDNNDKSTSKDKLPGSGNELSDSILLDPSKPPSIQNIIHPDLMAGGTFGGSFNMAGGVTRSDSKGEVSKPKPSMMKIGSGSGPKIARSPNIAPAQNASFGSVNIKNYQIQESAHYDEPSAQIIIMPPPQQPSQPQRKLASNTGKSNGVPPLFTLNRDINDIVSQAAFY